MSSCVRVAACLVVAAVGSWNVAGSAGEDRPANSVRIETTAGNSIQHHHTATGLPGGDGTRDPVSPLVAVK